MDSGGGGSTPSRNKKPLPQDGELVELMWRNGAVVEHSQAQAQAHGHYHQQRAFGRGPSGGDNTGASGVTGEVAAAAASWVPDGGSLGGDVYTQLWRNIAQLEGRVDGDTAASAWPPATSGVGSSRTGGEVGSSFCGSNDGGSSAAAAPWRVHVGQVREEQRAAQETQGRVRRRSEDADFEDVDDTRPSGRPASSKRRTRSAEVHNLSERRRRDRINEKMRALVELVPHCNKTDKASILDEAIEYLKSLQMQVQIMWMATGVAPMMLPGAHQLMSPVSMGLNSSCMPPTPHVLSQMQRVPVPPFMNIPLQNQMSGVSSAAASIPNVARNPFLHPNDTPAATHEVPSFFGYGSQTIHQNEIQELLAGAAAPDLVVELPSSSDGTGTT